MQSHMLLSVTTQKTATLRTSHPVYRHQNKQHVFQHAREVSQQGSCHTFWVLYVGPVPQVCMLLRLGVVGVVGVVTAVEKHASL